jgi:hypothetical protein
MRRLLVLLLAVVAFTGGTPAAIGTGSVVAGPVEDLISQIPGPPECC